MAVRRWQHNVHVRDAGTLSVLVMAQIATAFAIDDAFVRVTATLVIAVAAAALIALRTPRRRADRVARDPAPPAVLVEDPRVTSLRWQIERLEGEYLQHVEVAARHRDALTQDLRRRATDLARARRELARVDKARDEFVAVVAHEFRTPLAAIRSFVEILLSYKGELNEADRVQFLEIVRGQSARLSRLVDELLDASRIRAGRAQMQTCVVPLAPALTEVFEGMSMLARASGHVLELAPCDEQAEVYCDRERVVQIVTNLVSNALKYTAPGTRIEIEGKLLDPDRASIRVRDHGAGLSQHDAEHLFAPDYRDEAKGVHSRGTGLGLHISRDFARKMGGDLAASRTESGGACFTLTLPARAPRSAAEPATTAAAGPHL